MTVSLLQVRTLSSTLEVEFVDVLVVPAVASGVPVVSVTVATNIYESIPAFELSFSFTPGDNEASTFEVVIETTSLFSCDSFALLIAGASLSVLLSTWVLIIVELWFSAL